MIADLFSLYSCCGQSATKFSNCLYRACNCSNVIVYRRHPVSSMIPRCSTGMEITRLIPYFILLLDCGPGFPGPGLLDSGNIVFDHNCGHRHRHNFGLFVVQSVELFADKFALFFHIGVENVAGNNFCVHNFCFLPETRPGGWVTLSNPGTKIVFFS